MKLWAPPKVFQEEPKTVNTVLSSVLISFQKKKITTETKKFLNPNRSHTIFVRVPWKILLNNFTNVRHT